MCLEEGTQSAWLYEILSPHGTSDRGHVIGDVETRGAIRPGTASQAITNARRSAETVGSRAVAPHLWHHSLWRAGFEGEHPWIAWPTAFGGEVPRSSYAPSEYQTKQWLSEAQIERWFPHYEEEQLCFDANGIVRSSPVYCNTTRRDPVLVGNAHDQHVSERIATRDHSPSCYPDAGCQDHSVRRTGEVRLDIHTHRSIAKAIIPPTHGTETRGSGHNAHVCAGVRAPKAGF